MSSGAIGRGTVSSRRRGSRVYVSHVPPRAFVNLMTAR